MEYQNKPGLDGTQRPANPAPPSSSLLSTLGYVLRMIIILLSLIAAIIMGVAKETLSDDSTSLTVKSTYNSSFVYFIVINVLVLVYSVISLALTVTNRAEFGHLEIVIFIADIVTTVMIFTANSAAIAVLIIVDKGDSRFAWHGFCDPFSKFCGRIKAAIALSMIASVTFLVLLVLSAIHLHRRI